MAKRKLGPPEIVLLGMEWGHDAEEFKESQVWLWGGPPAKLPTLRLSAATLPPVSGSSIEETPSGMPRCASPIGPSICVSTQL